MWMASAPAAPPLLPSSPSSNIQKNDLQACPEGHFFEKTCRLPVETEGLLQQLPALIYGNDAVCDQYADKTGHSCGKRLGQTKETIVCQHL